MAVLVRPDGDVAARVRAVLGSRADPDRPPRRAEGAVRRARRRALGGTVLAISVVAAAVGAAALVPVDDGAGPVASAGPGGPGPAGAPAFPLARASVLELDQVSAVVRGVSSRAPAADVTPPVAGGYPRATYRGGWCGDAVLPGVPSPEQVWAAEWQQRGLAGTTAERGPDGAVREVVLRWSDAAGARAWAEVTRASPTRCRDPRGAPFPLTTYRPWTAITSATSATSLGAVPVWRVRATCAEGPTVVDLTVVLREPDAGSAVRSVAALLEAAVQRAGADGAGGAADRGDGAGGRR